MSWAEATRDIVGGIILLGIVLAFNTDFWGNIGSVGNETAPEEAEVHGEVISVFWDNIGRGWRMECGCNWQTCPCNTLGAAGEEMDEHFKEENK